MIAKVLLFVSLAAVALGASLPSRDYIPPPHPQTPYGIDVGPILGGGELGGYKAGGALSTTPYVGGPPIGGHRFGRPFIGGPGFGRPAIDGPYIGGPGIARPGFDGAFIGGPGFGIPDIDGPYIGGPGIARPNIGGPYIGGPRIDRPHIGRPPLVGYDDPYFNDLPRYDFEYAVQDDYTGSDFGHHETRDGYDTQGSYYVLLPDGRRQIVKYYVNGDSGYVAEVHYEGDAVYPQPFQLERGYPGRVPHHKGFPIQPYGGRAAVPLLPVVTDSAYGPPF